MAVGLLFVAGRCPAVHKRVCIYIVFSPGAGIGVLLFRGTRFLWAGDACSYDRMERVIGGPLSSAAQVKTTSRTEIVHGKEKKYAATSR